MSLPVGANIKKTDFIPPVKLEDGLKETIEYEFGLSPKIVPLERRVFLL